VTALTKGLDALEKALFAVAALALTAMTAVILLQVFLRYVVNSPTSWSEEFATLCFVWCVMLVIPLGIRHQEHISMEFLVNAIAGARWRWAQILLNAIVGLTIVAIGASSFGLFASGARQLLPGISMSAGLEIPLIVMYIAVPIGCFAAGLYALERIILLARGEITKPASPITDATIEGEVI
jgi:TRAP-type C4-dicarboxylate transport system permease small subunit